MGRLGGPAKTPTAILKQQGSRYKHRKGEPQLPQKVPLCPRHLNSDQKAVWRQIITMVKKLGVVRETDANALERYCVLWVRWRQAAKFLEENDETYVLKDSAGKARCAMQWPQVSIVNKIAILLLRLEQEFGLTPASRAAVKVDLTVTHQGPMIDWDALALGNTVDAIEEKIKQISQEKEEC